MANSGPNTNCTNFFICTAPCPHLDGKHVVFGKVVSGLDVAYLAEKEGSESGKVRREVSIADCGEVDVNKATRGRSRSPRRTDSGGGAGDGIDNVIRGMSAASRPAGATSAPKVDYEDY